MLNSEVAYRWYQMGVILGVSVGKLKEIRLSQPTAQNSEMEMFTEFLRTNKDTWQLLVDAVGHEAGGNNLKLAQTLSKKIAKKLSGNGVNVYIYFSITVCN